jgi:phospholipid/cholesterol/gamma-HCH transport system substrate-binding protein
MSRAARLGAFIVATLAILVAGVFIIGSKRYLFSSTYQVKTQFDDVAGLDVGGDVRVGGVHVEPCARSCCRTIRATGSR